ncbi:uncharacterized protein [Pleurodeles waltl]|uniref:uncharacterized protein isoform X2 n=2 Tax=Pleurodeles waltl TaxID=8319 RepID=UPI003709B3E7
MDGDHGTDSRSADLSTVLITNQHVTNLQLGYNALGDSRVMLLWETPKHSDCKLQKLGLIQCDLVGLGFGELTSVVGKSQTLTELDISGNDLGVSGVTQLWEELKHPSCTIKSLDLSDCCLTELHWRGLSSALSSSLSLTELNLNGNVLLKSGVRELCEGLKHSGCRLQNLQILHCTVTATCCADLASAFSINQSLTELNLGENELTDSGMKLLCGGLVHPSCKLKKLNLWRCSLTGDCCADLSTLLKANSSLTDLILDGNTLGDSGVRLLCEGLKHPGCTLQKLDLTGCSLTSSSCEDLASVLSTNQSLTVLTLSDNDLGDTGVARILEGLKHPACVMHTLMMDGCSLTCSVCGDIASLLRTNTSLTELDLGGNELGDSGVQQLCEGLMEARCKIQTLGVNSCSLTSSACQHLSSILRTHQTLSELCLVGNNVGDSGVKQLCEGLKSPSCVLQKLQLQHCSLTGLCCEDLASVLMTSASLEELDMSHNHLGDSGVKLLSAGLKHHSCKLLKLRIESCSLTDSCCSDLADAFRTNQHLMMLDLSSNAVQDSGMRQLCEGLRHPGCRLQRLEIESCSLTDSCCSDLADAFRTNQHLMMLDLSSNAVQDSGMRQLCEGLRHPGCRLQRLELCNCGLTTCCCADLSSVLSVSQTLTELQLSGNALMDSGVRTLCEGLVSAGCQVQKLELDNCSLTGSCFGELSCESRRLHVNQCTFTGSCMEDLSCLLSSAPSLTELELSDNVLGDVAARLLCEALKRPGCRVQKLGIGECSLTGSCCRDLASLLSTCESLRELDLSDNELKDCGVKQLCEGLTHHGCKIRKLEIMRCSLTGSSCEFIATALLVNRSLEELDLTSNELGDSGVRHLSEGLRHPDCSLQKLRIINCSLTGSCCQELSSALRMNQSLLHLHMGLNKLEDSGIEELCDGLKSPGCRIQTLMFFMSNLTASSCAALSSVLCTSSSLQELDLSGNELGDPGVSQLCQGLKHQGCKLQKLDISDGSLTGLCCEDLASVLTVNQSLVELILSQNVLSDSGVRRLCEGLKHQECKLQTLWLDSCSLTASCCPDVSSVLSSNQSLTELHLADNKLEDSGVQQIFNGLKHPNCRIQKLWTWHCSMTDACCEDLSSALYTSPSLTHLEMCGNEIGDDGVRKICEGLKHPGCKMQTVGIGSSSFTDACCAEIASVLSINHSLTEVDLSDNTVGDAGVTQLCEGFKHPDCTIPRLRLWMCSLTDSCCAALASVLGSSACLKELKLSYNALGDIGLRHLCDGLKHPNCRLEKLELLHCSFTSACSKDLSSAVSMNHSLLDLNLADNELGDVGMRGLFDGLRQSSRSVQTQEQ